MMKSKNAAPNETLEIGTPRDYTSDLYRVCFAIGEKDEAGLNILTEYIGADNARRIIKLAHGYESELPIQCIPDVIQLLVRNNVAIYQLVRYAKTSETRD